jgi:hypothetical protein
MSPAFVEPIAPQATGTQKCLIELEGRRGNPPAIC